MSILFRRIVLFRWNVKRDLDELRGRLSSVRGMRLRLARLRMGGCYRLVFLIGM
jgi:hypothetical protein